MPSLQKTKNKKSFQRIAIPKTMTRDIQKLFHEKWMKSLSVANSATEKNAVKIKKKTLQKNEHHLSLPSNNKIHQVVSHEMFMNKKKIISCYNLSIQVIFKSNALSQ